MYQSRPQQKFLLIAVFFLATPALGYLTNLAFWQKFQMTMSPLSAVGIIGSASSWTLSVPITLTGTPVACASPGLTASSTNTAVIASSQVTMSGIFPNCVMTLAITGGTAGYTTLTVTATTGTASAWQNLDLSILTPPTATFALWNAVEGFAGSAINVRRSTDNTAQNIGFNLAGNLNTTALTTFESGGNGYVTLWYDQSGNGDNAAQTTAANQPQIVTGLTFNGTSDSLSLNSIFSTLTKVAVETWVSATSPSTAGTLLVTNVAGSATTNGFHLRQSNTLVGRAEFVIGKKYFSYRDYVLSLKPVAYWRLDESSGTTANDLSANHYNGIYSGGYTLGASGALSGSGDSDTAVLFDGSSGQAGGISLPPAALLDWTEIAWVKTTNTSAGVIFTNRQGSGNASLTLDIGYEGGSGKGDGFTYFTLDSNGCEYGAVGTSNVADGNWHQVAGVRQNVSGNEVYSVYVDGVLQSSNNTSVNSGCMNTSATSTDSWVIGYGQSWGSYFNGLIDEVAVFNYALSTTQISNLYLAGTTTTAVAYPGNAVLANNPVGYWRLGEKSGLIAYDSSGAGNNGTYTGGVQLRQPGAITGSGDSDTAALFDGTSGYIAIPSTASMNVSTGWSISAWAKFTSLPGGDATILTDINGSPNYVQFCLGNCGVGSGGVVAGYYVGGFFNSPTYTVTTAQLNTWLHFVGVYSGTAGTVSLYANGALVGTTTGAAATVPTDAIGARIARRWDLANYIGGTLDEIALFNYPLSPTQIATLYNSGNGAGWWFCQSLTSLNSSYWNLLSGIYNGTTLRLFNNGQLECSVTPGTTYSGSLATTVVGANSTLSTFWTGVMSYLGLTASSSAPLTATNVYTDFLGTANHLRNVPIENIVNTNLVAHFDAGNAQVGTAAYANGCPTSAFSWFDLSPNASNATLFNFSSCGSTTGWYSTSASGPFYLALNGSNNYVNTSLASTYSTYTFEAWTYVSSLITNAAVISSAGAATTYLNLGSGTNPWQFNSAAATAAAVTGTWTHVVGVQNGSGQTLYVNGALVGTASASTSVSAIDIGRRGDGVYFKGLIGLVRVYSVALSQQQVKQNCVAQQARFGVSGCIYP